MDYDGPPREEYVEERHISANYVSRATKVFVIHMATLVVVCTLIGVWWCTEAMWVFGGFTTFFMFGWHGVNIQKAIDKEKEERRYEE